MTFIQQKTRTKSKSIYAHVDNKSVLFCPTLRKQEERISDEEASSYVVCNGFVKLVVRCMGEDKILNFLYKVPLITRVKISNVIVGRKYAKNERCL